MFEFSLPENPHSDVKILGLRGENLPIYLQVLQADAVTPSWHHRPKRNALQSEKPINPMQVYNLTTPLFHSASFLRYLAVRTGVQKSTIRPLHPPTRQKRSLTNLSTLLGSLAQCTRAATYLL